MQLDFAKTGGMIPAVNQEHATGRVLMVGFMNEEAFQKTVETGRGHEINSASRSIPSK